MLSMRVVVGLFISAWIGCGLLDGDEQRRYTVVKGDTLTRIAKRHGVTVDEIQDWNGLKTDQIDIGQVLILGSTARTPDSRREHLSRPVTKKRASTPSRPSPKPCLKGPSLDELDNDVADIRSSKGLSGNQIRTAVSGTLPGLSRCFTGAWPDGVVDLEFTVSCTGLVDTIRVLDSGGIADDAVRCMVSSLRQISFPAHDMPDGMVFRYPVTLSPG